MELIRTEFPDCQALRQVGLERWQRVWIEFEYESRNFLKHFHYAIKGRHYCVLVAQLAGMSVAGD